MEIQKQLLERKKENKRYGEESIYSLGYVDIAMFRHQLKQVLKKIANDTYIANISL